MGIIGILSLIGLPIYNDYKTRIKLTEIVTRHLYLTRQLEIELNYDGIDGVYNYMRGTYSSNPTVDFNIGGFMRVLECDTNAGLSAGGKLNVTAYSSNISFYRGLVP